MFRIVCFLLLTTLASAIEAPYGPWQQAKIGGGGYWTGYRMATAHIHYAWSDVAGLFRSDDGGTSFRMVSDHQPGSLLAIRGAWIDPQDPNQVVVAAGWQWQKTQGLYRTQDGGRTWTLVLRAQFYGNENGRMAGNVLVQDPLSGALVVGTGGDGVWRSIDRGQTWTTTGIAGVEVCDLDADPHHGGRMLLHARKASYWREGKQVHLGGGAWESINGGATWKVVTEAGPHEVMADPTVPDRWYGIVDYANLVRSTDGGRTWAPWHTGLPPGTGLADCAQPGFFGTLLVQEPAVILVAGDGKVWRRAHDAATWERQPSTADLGTSHLSDPFFPRFGRAAAELIADPADGRHLVLGDWYAIHTSQDGGRSWSIHLNGLENTVIHRIATDVSDPSRIYLGMADNGVFTSRDGGATWTSWWHAAGNTKDLAVANGRIYGCVPSDHGWKANWLMSSSDSGATWARVAMNGLTGLDSERINSVVVDPANPLRVTVARSGEIGQGAGGVWVSNDGGTAWLWSGEGLPTGKAMFAREIWDSGRQLAWGSDDTLLASGSCGLYRRSGDTSFSCVVDAPNDIRDLVADRLLTGVYWAAAASGTWRSGDGGRTWKHLHIAAAERIAVDERRAGRVVVALGEELGLIISDDHGASWRAAPAGLPNRTGLRPAIAGDRLVVGTSGNSVFWLGL